MEEQQVRWSQSGLQAAEGGFGVAESLLLVHQHVHPLSRTQLAKQGLSRERGCAGAAPASWLCSVVEEPLWGFLGCHQKSANCGG